MFLWKNYGSELFWRNGSRSHYISAVICLGGLIALFSKFELSRNSYLRTTIQIKPSDLARCIFLRAKQTQLPWILRISSL